MKKYIKYISLVLSVVLLLLCGMPYVSAEEETENIDAGFVLVTDYGADGMDSLDDSAAFEAALATGKNIYVPRGSYRVSKTIEISDRIIRGAGVNVTEIRGTMTDITQPIISVDGISSVYDMTIGYSSVEEVQNTNQGEKVGIQLGTAEKPLMPGSVVRNVYFHRVGTGLYNPANAGCSGTIMENLFIYPYYCGVNMQGENRIANSYSNIYINAHVSKKATIMDSGITLAGSSYGETLHQINVEHCTYETASMALKNAHNINIAVMHFEGVNLASDNLGWIFAENTTGYLGAFTNYFTYIDTYKNSMIRFGDSEGTSKFYIGILHNRGLNAPDNSSHLDWIEEIEKRGVQKGMVVGGDTAADFRLFRRAKGAKGDYQVTLDYYTYYAYVKGDTPYYLNYMNKNEDLTLILKHKAKEAMR
ncbi:MAG: hypothetical protein E7545_01745 [Ruminococcaceae bacterium]|nr:hypothetical protein [Oscillospiraceae bacterium]